MNPSEWFFRLNRYLIMIAVVTLASSSASAEWKEKVLYSFQGGTDGSLPAGGVVFDSAGNLYGATADGGSSCPSPGCGTVFQLAPPARNGDPWTETVLHVFNGNDGSRPAGSVILDANGNLYGTTAYGGSGTCILLGGNVGCGLVYELSPPAEKDGRWKYSILYSFQGGKDGQYPVQNLTLDTAGNLYGATLYGGGFGTCDAPYYLYCGTIFKLSPPKKNGDGWNESVLHSFKSGTDGANPDGSLALDSKGAIYGTTYAGGTQNCTYQGYVGCGTAFRLSPPNKKGSAWTEKQLHVFAAKSDGANPAGDLIFDAQGSLYGTAAGGSNSGDGVVFRLTAVGHGRWKDTVLREFTRNDKYGADPVAGLTFDPIGDLYGTTYSGNTYSGSVFQLKPPAQKGATWTAGILHGFTGSPDGAQPAANLIFDREGNLYSTTQKGGTGKCSFYGCGTVYEVSR